MTLCLEKQFTKLHQLFPALHAALFNDMSTNRARVCFLFQSEMYPSFYLTPTARKQGSSDKQQNNTKTKGAAQTFSFFSPISTARSALNFLKHFSYTCTGLFFPHGHIFSLISTLSQNNWLLQASENETAIRGKQIMIIPVLMKSGRSLNCFREETDLVTLKQKFIRFAVQPFLVQKLIYKQYYSCVADHKYHSLAHHFNIPLQPQ